MAGVTFLALGNGSPDVFSTFAAMRTHSGSLAVGELIGAAGFITAVVAGSMALVRPFKVTRRSFVRDVGFFIVAASFSMAFLYHGSLHLWECIVMVAFYAFYVCTVVAWHWWLARRRSAKEREYAARGQYYVTGAEQAESEAYHDGDDAEEGSGVVGGRRRDPSIESVEDFAALERGTVTAAAPVTQHDADEDDEEEARDRWLAELNSNMRLNRPPSGPRRSNANPIRPSLVGALEFQAILSSLHKSRTIQTIPINLRRYSDDPNYTTTQRHDQISNGTDPEPSPNVNLLDSDNNTLGPTNGAYRGHGASSAAPGNRTRAVSTNDAFNVSVDPDLLKTSPSPTHPVPPPPRLQIPEQPQCPGTGGSSPSLSPVPALSLSPPTSLRESGSPSPAPSANRMDSSDRLAPPSNRYGASPPSPGALSPTARSPTASPKSRSPMSSPTMTPQRLPRVMVPRSPVFLPRGAPGSAFPAFTESPVMTAHASPLPPGAYLPPPSISLDSPYHHEDGETDLDRPIRWWPYNFMPAPRILAATLFPTIYSWKDKNAWEKFLALIAAPSILLLAITLPVVELELEDEELTMPVDAAYATTPVDEVCRVQALPSPAAHPHNAGRASSHAQSDHVRPTRTAPKSTPPATEATTDRAAVAAQADASGASPKDWNRWLVSIHIVTAPLFVVVVVWANSTDDPTDARTLLRPCLYSLLGSCVALVFLNLTTTTGKPPRWRFLLCFLGFVVSVTWISTIANEVVGVLKALGVILGISDAILGLTVFAVGNSLGDLVADITVARLGYPVMALSACFGGPMLNILLGIGVSGLYMTLSHGSHQHAKHPHRKIKYKPYEIEVSSTLLISGATLLVTLVGLLIVVPLNRWRMDRKIGWGLITLWTISTIGNLVVEATGWLGNVS